MILSNSVSTEISFLEGYSNIVSFRSLSPSSKLKVRAFCDVDARKIRRGVHEEYDEKERRVTARIPIVDVR